MEKGRDGSVERTKCGKENIIMTIEKSLKGNSWDNKTLPGLSLQYTITIKKQSFKIVISY